MPVMPADDEPPQVPVHRELHGVATRSGMA
jgi:hypothetical protein